MAEAAKQLPGIDMSKQQEQCCPTCHQPIKKKGQSAPVWAAYSEAYRNRYGTDPVRNAKVSSQCSQLVDRLGIEDAPLVAAFYVNHNNKFYVESAHPVGLLLRDAEGLRTQWKTGKRVTSINARQVEKTDANLNAHDEAMAILADKRNRR